MTPKEKAKELRDKYINVRWDIYPDDAQQCALIAVDEILNEDYDLIAFIWQEEFWREVKNELEKL